MANWTLFDLYRYLLAVVVGTYVILRTVSFFWRWQFDTGVAERGEALLRRYVVTLLIRSRVRRLWLDCVQVVALVAIFVYLLYLHR